MPGEGINTNLNRKRRRASWIRETKNKASQDVANAGKEKRSKGGKGGCGSSLAKREVSRGRGCRRMWPLPCYDGKSVKWKGEGAKGKDTEARREGKAWGGSKPPRDLTSLMRAEEESANHWVQNDTEIETDVGGRCRGGISSKLTRQRNRQKKGLV